MLHLDSGNLFSVLSCQFTVTANECRRASFLGAVLHLGQEKAWAIVFD